jgi:hypothetical protein
MQKVGLVIIFILIFFILFEFITGGGIAFINRVTSLSKITPINNGELSVEYHIDYRISTYYIPFVAYFDKHTLPGHLQLAFLRKQDTDIVNITLESFGYEDDKKKKYLYISDWKCIFPDKNIKHVTITAFTGMPEEDKAYIQCGEIVSSLSPCKIFAKGTYQKTDGNIIPFEINTPVQLCKQSDCTICWIIWYSYITD